ncbi:uncharacterized protein LOC141674091 [Apium graveolens]|uniref:uncharacterized protein LOC141674091 n=1 Tax=Apium graveolens TaxID=4045 RepID=UPI003D792ABA
MSDDILIIRRHLLNDPHLYLSDDELQNYALAATSRRDFDDKAEIKILHEKNHGMLNPEQKNVYDSIIQNVYYKVDGVFFVYEVEGAASHFCGRHYDVTLHSEGKIVLHVALCGISAVLFPGGRTAHSRFHIPLKLDQDSTAGIRHGIDIAELIQQTDLII